MNTLSFLYGFILSSLFVLGIYSIYEIVNFVKKALSTKNIENNYYDQRSVVINNSHYFDQD